MTPSTLSPEPGHYYWAKYKDRCLEIWEPVEIIDEYGLYTIGSLIFHPISDWIIGSEIFEPKANM